MSWVEATSILGNVGEFVGAFAVVITLIYLAAQVKLSKEATEANTRQMEENRRLSLVENYLRRSERVEAGYRDGALSSDLSEIVFKAMQDFDSLSEVEAYRLREWSHAHMHQLDAQHYQYQHGLLEDEAYQNLRKVLARYAPIWQKSDVQLPRASFQKEVDEILKAQE